MVHIKTHNTLVPQGACLSHSFTEPQIFPEHYCIGRMGGKVHWEDASVTQRLRQPCIPPGRAMKMAHGEKVPPQVLVHLRGGPWKEVDFEIGLRRPVPFDSCWTGRRVTGTLPMMRILHWEAPFTARLVPGQDLAPVRLQFLLWLLYFRCFLRRPPSPSTIEVKTVNWVWAPLWSIDHLFSDTFWKYFHWLILCFFFF